MITVRPSLFIALFRIGMEGRTSEEDGVGEDMYGGGG